MELTLNLPYVSYSDLWWSTFTSLWTWIANNNALVQMNKFLIDDLARSEDLLDKASRKLGKKWVLPKGMI